VNQNHTKWRLSTGPLAYPKPPTSRQYRNHQQHCILFRKQDDRLFSLNSHILILLGLNSRRPPAPISRIAPETNCVSVRIQRYCRSPFQPAASLLTRSYPSLRLCRMQVLSSSRLVPHRAWHQGRSGGSHRRQPKCCGSARRPTLTART
jgi:hypothetical protein